jgi:hypothetical protein
MNFLFGYLIGRSLYAGPRRPASPGTGLFLYGGAFAIGIGLLCLSRPWGGWLALAGLCFVLLAAVLQGHERNRDSPGGYYRNGFNDSTVGGAVFGTVISIVVIVGLFSLLHK